MIRRFSRLNAISHEKSNQFCCISASQAAGKQRLWLRRGFDIRLRLRLKSFLCCTSQICRVLLLFPISIFFFRYARQRLRVYFGPFLLLAAITRLQCKIRQRIWELYLGMPLLNDRSRDGFGYGQVTVNLFNFRRP